MKTMGGDDAWVALGLLAAYGFATRAKKMESGARPTGGTMDANLRRQTLADTLRRSAARVPDRLGLACGATRWTYREFHAVSERLAWLCSSSGASKNPKLRNVPGYRARGPLFFLRTIRLDAAAALCDKAPVRPIHVIGGGLAGSEATWQAAEAGIPVVLHEMRPVRRTEAHRTSHLAELVCSNSFRSDDASTNAVGVLHREMRALGSIVMRNADAH